MLICDLDLQAAAAARLRDTSHRPAARRVSSSARRLEPLTLPAGNGDALAGNTLAAPIAPREAEVYSALKLGLHDYVHKNGFQHVVLGLSGGIDSALVACVAADALGGKQVSVAIMPSPHSSEATQLDARELARRLTLPTHELEITTAMDAYARTLEREFAGFQADVTEENLQARIRGNLLMGLSNKFGWLVLTTGNKSEMSVGYTTLYGDLAGGFAVIKDVPKTLVYSLCRWRNSAEGATQGAIARPIPESIIERAPSAESASRSARRGFATTL